jgi:hypothetical protein
VADVLNLNLYGVTMYKKVVFLILSMGLVTNSLAFKALPFMGMQNKSSENSVPKQRKVSDEPNAGFLGDWRGTCSSEDFSFPMELLIDDSYQVKINGQNYRTGHNTYSFTNRARVISEHARLDWANHGNTLKMSFIDIQEHYADDEYFSIFTKMSLSLDNNKLVGEVSQNTLDHLDANEVTLEKISCSLEKLSANFS